MHLRHRAFLLSFIPFAVLLTLSFLMVQRLVRSAVREALRSAVRENHQALGDIDAKSELQNSRFLKIAGENASLKAGIRLALSMPSSAEARSTVEDQLRDLCERMGFDLLSVSASDGTPLAGVLRTGTEVLPMNPQSFQKKPAGLLSIEGNIYQMASVPIDQGDESIGLLAVGQRYRLSEVPGPAVLMERGRVVQLTVPGVPVSDLDNALRSCGTKTECDVKLGNTTYIALALQRLAANDGYRILSLQNVDRRAEPVQAALSNVFGSVVLGALVVAILFSFVSSNSIAGPIASVVSHLKSADRTGLLPEFTTAPSSIREIRELTESFNRAASSIKQAREDLQHAYVEFIGSLANALDARDPYSSGHSQRVSELAGATAAALGLDDRERKRIEIGALLHDIGKIGVSDIVLRKPGKLTASDFAAIREHPLIGRRILDGVSGFKPYLNAVELHHENWDGSGYPHGQKGEETPLDARIIHVSDAYDAMTTDRPYRRGMSHRQAIHILRSVAGSQFDPKIVEVFAGLPSHGAAVEEREFAGVS